MRILVRIDLSRADLRLFEAYEEEVLALLSRHGAALEARVRTLNEREEVHLLHFPGGDELEAFLRDPVRLAAQEKWMACGAKLISEQVRRID